MTNASTSLQVTSGDTVDPRTELGALRVAVRSNDTENSRTSVTATLVANATVDSSAQIWLTSTTDITNATIDIDYSRIKNTGASDFENRLILVESDNCRGQGDATPARCALTRPLASTNDQTQNVLSATTRLLQGKPKGIRLTSATSGSTGSYGASSLAPTGTWSAEGPIGTFGWTYPIDVPDPASGSGVAPSVALNYSSSDIDGRTAGTNNQSSWIGLGWDYHPGYIERTLRTCSTDETPGSKDTSDLCWAGDIVTMSLGGGSTQLVASGGEWHPAEDSGQKISFTGPSLTTGYRGEHWVVTTLDGTQYYFGRKSLPGATQSTNSVLTAPVYGPHDSDPCHAIEKCTQAYRWNLDYVRDVFGNATAYYYNPPETNYYGQNEQDTPVVYDRYSTLKRIDYGLRLDPSVGANGSLYTRPAPRQIVFTSSTDKRCFSTASNCDLNTLPVPLSKQAYWQDTPVDLLCNATSCDKHSPSFFTTTRLTKIETKYRNPAGTYSVVDTYNLTQTFPYDTAAELLLDAIDRTGSDGGTVNLDPVTFEYEPLDNRVQDYDTTASPMSMSRMKTITAETGAKTTITLSGRPRNSSDTLANTGRCLASDLPKPASATDQFQRTNTRLCYPVKWTKPYTEDPTLDYFWKYVVTKVTVTDPLSGPNGASPPIVTSYFYDGPPAWHYDETELTADDDRTYNQFRGYETVETRVGAATTNTNGSTDKLTRKVTRYFRGMDDRKPASVW